MLNMRDYKKRLKHDMQGNFFEPEKSKSKSKPVVIDNDWIRPYWLARDRQLWKEGKSINELKIKYNL